MSPPGKRCFMMLLLLHHHTCLGTKAAVEDRTGSILTGDGRMEQGGWRMGGGAFLSVLHPFRRVMEAQGSRRKLLQTPGPAVPFSPLKVMTYGKPCILFRSRRLSILYQNHSVLDLTHRAFSTQNPVDTKGSVCSKDKAVLLMRFGDVEELRGVSIRLQMSSRFYEAAGSSWFSLDTVSIQYNRTQEAHFNASEVFAPSTSSFHCQHVSSLQRYGGLLRPSTAPDPATHWAITFTDFQIQAFNVLSGKFAPHTDCSTFFTPAILMGLITSLILLLVLAYALHMVIHLKHIDHDDQHKTTVYFPRSPEPSECCSASHTVTGDKNSL